MKLVILKCTLKVNRKKFIFLESTGHGVAAIGLTTKNFPTNKQPGFNLFNSKLGWLDGSYGYHGDDGNKFHNSGSPGLRI
jgi:hypothetical protein